MKNKILYPFLAILFFAVGYVCHDFKYQRIDPRKYRMQHHYVVNGNDTLMFYTLEEK